MNNVVKKALEYIQGVICENYLVTPEQLISATRKRAVFYPRAVAMYISRRLVPVATLDEIGSLYQRDKSSVINGIEQIGYAVKQDPKEAEHLERLENEIKSRWKIPLEPEGRTAGTEFVTPEELIKIMSLAEEMGFFIDSLRSRNVKC